MAVSFCLLGVLTRWVLDYSVLRGDASGSGSSTARFDWTPLSVVAVVFVLQPSGALARALVQVGRPFAASGASLSPFASPPFLSRSSCESSFPA